MTLERVKEEIKDHGISQWYDKRGLNSIYKEPDGYCIYISTGNRLSTGKIVEEYHGLDFSDIAKFINE